MPPHIHAMPDEVLLEISKCLTSEKDALNLMITSKRLHNIGEASLLRLNAARSGSGLRWAIVNGKMSLFEAMLQRYRYPLNVAYDTPTCIRTTGQYDRSHVKIQAATPLITAVAYGRIEFVERLLQAGADINFAPSFDFAMQGIRNPHLPSRAARHWKPIHWALEPSFQQSNMDIITTLLNHGADVQVTTGDYHLYKAYSPLMLAAGNKSVSKTMLRHLLPLSMSGYSRRGVQQACDRVLSEFFLCSRDPDYNSWMRLDGQDDMAKLHIILEFIASNQAGTASVNSLRRIVGRFLPGPQLLQCVKMHLDFILQEDPIITVNDLNYTGLSPLTAAVKGLELTTLHPLEAFDDTATLDLPPEWLLEDPQTSYETLFNMLLAAGASPDGGDVQNAAIPNELDRDANTPLTVLCGSARLWVGSNLGAHFTRFFIHRNASYELCDTGGNTPLQQAAINCVVDAASLLLDLAGPHGICDTEPGSYSTLLTLVCLADMECYKQTPADQLRFLELLLNHGADVCKTDSSNRTALYHLCINASSSCYEWHSNMSGYDDTWVTSLIKLLLEAGADVSHRGDRGVTPLEVVKTNKVFSSTIVDLMESYAKRPTEVQKISAVSDIGASTTT